MILPLRNKKRGFSIIEVIIAAALFAFVAVGIISMTSSIRPKSTISERSVGAALVAKMVLDRLRGKVDAATYDTGPLKVTSGWVLNQITVGSTTYNVYFMITNHAATGGRNIVMQVNWLDVE